jgi:hypothetical protein
LHHPPIEPGGWLNRKLLDNRDIFNKLIRKYEQVKLVLYGHTHYNLQTSLDGILYTSASSIGFAFDKELSKYIVRLIIIGLNPTNASRSVSEDTDSRMTFRGVPICGHIDTVRQKLESLGYTFIEYLPNGIVLKGEFAGKTGCEICIIGSAITHEAWKILVCFPEQESWYMLKKEYFQYKQILVDKYGKPDEYEYFEYPYQDGDGEELTALHNNKCSFQSFFKTDKGYITITIKSTDYILLDFEDNIGAELATNEKETKAKSDI